MVTGHPDPATWRSVLADIAALVVDDHWVRDYVSTALVDLAGPSPVTEAVYGWLTGDPYVPAVVDTLVGGVLADETAHVEPDADPADAWRWLTRTLASDLETEVGRRWQLLGSPRATGGWTRALADAVIPAAWATIDWWWIADRILGERLDRPS